jgi:transposase-like protein/IS1 family transposase
MTCHNCRSECRRFGKRANRQRYQCTQCRKVFTDARDNTLDGMYLPIEKAEMVLRLLLEGNSISSVVRLADVHQKTVLKLLALAGSRCEKLLSEKIHGLKVAEVQCDELWGFVWCKEKNKPTDSPFIGDAWCYVGIEKSSKLILAWHLGRRDAQHTVEFTEKLREATSGRLQVTTDGWGPYPAAMEYSLGTRADYAKLIKVYRATRPDEARYSPAEVVSTEVVPVMGNPITRKFAPAISSAKISRFAWG